MYELKVTATKVLGVCTADSPVKPGDTFTVCDGDIRIPAGGVVCLWALHSLLPLITPKEREIIENEDEDWLWRVHHAQCPDPKGRVIFKIERVGKVEKGKGRGKMEDGGTGEQRIESVERIEGASHARSAPPLRGTKMLVPVGPQSNGPRDGLWSVANEVIYGGEKGEEGKPRDLRVVVEEVRGRCTSGMRPGDYFLLRSGRLIIPAHRHFCLYALQAVLPFLAAKQRHLQDGDWLKDEHHFICPDPAGNVIMRVEQYP